MKISLLHLFKNQPQKWLLIVILFLPSWSCFKPVFSKSINEAKTIYIKNFFQIDNFKLTRQMLDFHDIYGDMHVVGSIKNAGNKTIKYFKLRARAMDSNKSIIDSAYTDSKELLLPNFSANYDFIIVLTEECKYVDLEVVKIKFK